MSKNQSYQAWFILIILAIIWGSSFILIKRGLVAFPADQVAAIRLIVSFIFISPFAIIWLRKIPRDKRVYCILVGFVGTGIPAFLFAFAQTHISSSMAGMLNTLTPVFVLVLGQLFFKLSVNNYKKIGIAIGFVGALMLVLSSADTPGQFSKYSMLIVLATVCYAISVNIMHKYLAAVNSIAITTMALLFVGPPAGVYLFTTDFIDRMLFHDDALMSVGSIALLALFSTTIATVIFNKLVQMTGAIFSSAITYLIPIVALIWGFVDGEQLLLVHFAGLAAILCGIYLINKR